MAFTYDTDTNRGKVRLIIGDTSSGSYVFEDAEIDAFLTLNGSEVKLAAVQALRTLAADRAKLAIRYRVKNFDLDRSAVSKALLDAADRIEQQAMSEPFEYESYVDTLIDTAGRDRSAYLDTQENS